MLRNAHLQQRSPAGGPANYFTLPTRCASSCAGRASAWLRTAGLRRLRFDPSSRLWPAECTGPESGGSCQHPAGRRTRLQGQGAGRTGRHSLGQVCGLRPRMHRCYRPSGCSLATLEMPVSTQVGEYQPKYKGGWRARLRHRSRHLQARSRPSARTCGAIIISVPLLHAHSMSHSYSPWLAITFILFLSSNSLDWSLTMPSSDSMASMVVEVEAAASRPLAASCRSASTGSSSVGGRGKGGVRVGEGHDQEVPAHGG